MFYPADISPGSWVFPANRARRRRPAASTTSAARRALGRARPPWPRLGGAVGWLAMGTAAITLERVLYRLLEDDLIATMTVMILTILLLTLLGPLLQTPRR
ncbi:hypothetical protein U1769_09365 [Sphingomonas sp. ZT3P38]|uniref:hypothetical protein n=1 Tax=Parasphingomonas zepuensis TaxID=3096161 RepID=UPI002FC6D440